MSVVGNSSWQKVNSISCMMFGGLWIVEFGYQCRHQGHIGVWHESGRACAWGEGGGA